MTDTLGRSYNKKGSSCDESESTVIKNFGGPPCFANSSQAMQ